MGSVGWRASADKLLPRMRKLKILAVSALMAVVLSIFAWLQWIPPQATGETVSFEIPKGASTAQIASILAEKNLIRSEILFRAAVLLGGQSADLKAGTYELPRGSSIPEILDAIGQGKVKPNTVRFTIPEGYTLEQIADALAKKGLADRERFLREADTGTFDYGFFRDIPQTPGMRHRLEGYLFPDTYEIKKGATEREIVDVMLKRFDQVVTPEMRSSFKAKGLSLHEAVTIASLVEREARVAKERPVIAGVIFNRLMQDPPMLLQIDATVQYAVGQKEELLLKDLEIDSPYNTYKRKGLPPGPIAAPGRDSLNAAAFPDRHEYLFYVTKKDGSGEHYFAKTLDEHNRNIALSERNKGN